MSKIRLQTPDGATIDLDDDGTITPVKSSGGKAVGVAQEDYDRATEIDRRHRDPTGAPTDAQLGIESDVARPAGVNKYRTAPQELPPDFKPEQPLGHEDPAMDIATTMAGGAGGKLIGKGIAKLSPIAAKIVEPAVGGALTSALQGGSAKQNLIAAGIGGALGVPGAALKLIRGAPAAVAERIPTAVTGGLKSKAAKQVVAGDALGDALTAHPGLKNTLATSGSVAEKFNATGSTLGKLTTANDAVYDAIQAQHQGIPLDGIAKKIQGVAAAAHADGNEVLEKAAESAIENLQRYGDVADKRGLVATATQVRGVRNNLARKVQALNPTLGPSDAQAAADEIKRAINEGIEDIAGKTKGVDVDALRARNKQIAALLPVQRTLREQALAAKLMEGHDPLADFIADPKKKVAGLVSAIPAHADAAMSNSPRLQALADTMRSPLTPGAAAALDAGTASQLARRANSKPAQNDLEYSALVAQKMKNGMSLKEAMDDAAQAR